MTTRYALVSDIHRDPAVIDHAIRFAKNNDISSIILNGDIGEPQHITDIHGQYNPKASLQATQDYVARVLDPIAKSGLEAYLQPGSHEQVQSFQPVVDDFSSKFGNIHDMIQQRTVHSSDHDLVFLPGSDWVASGEYQITSAVPEGLYVRTDSGLVDASQKDVVSRVIQQGSAQGLLRTIHPSSLEQYVTDPESTIVVCHVPAKFSSIDFGVDMAYFGETQTGAVVPGVVLEHHIKQQVPNASAADVRNIALQNGYALRRENRGNQELSELYSSLGLTKQISGHFHESSHRATTLDSKFIESGKWTDNLAWNSGQLDQGLMGVLEVDGPKVRYFNVDAIDQTIIESGNITSYK